MKEFLQNLIKNKKEKLTELQGRSDKSSDLNEVRSIGLEIDNIKEEIRNAEVELSNIETKEQEDLIEQNLNNRNAFNPNQALNVLYSTSMNQTQNRTENDNPLSTLEYRQAFMNYAKTGVRSDVLNNSLIQYRTYQLRSEGTNSDEIDLALNETVSTDLGVLLPHTVVQELIKKISKVRGQLYSRVKKLNVRGGVEYPIGEFDATFYWNGADGNDTEHGVSPEQKGGKVEDSVIFAYHIGEVRIAQSLLQSVLTLDAFEEELINAIFVAYITSWDKSILKGTGVKQPLGILTEAKKENGSRIDSSHIIDFTEAEIADWTKWESKLFSQIPLAMEAENPEFVMAKQTYVSNLCTLKDANNQPINKAGFDSEDKKHKFNEYEVSRTEKDIFNEFNNAKDGEFFGMFWVPEKAYAINTNMAFGYKKYYDDDKNKWITKGLTIADGKPLNTDYIYLLRKKVTTIPKG